jgi:hypothetical protein
MNQVTIVNWWFMRSGICSLPTQYLTITSRNLIRNELIEYTIPDGRNVKVMFTGEERKTWVTETFETENIHPAAMQQAGWQSILDNFKRYVESHK